MTRRPTRVWLWVSGLLVSFLLAAVITLGSFDFMPNKGQWTDVFVFFALSEFIVAALVVFSLVLGRSLLRLWAERRRGQLGVRFKTKMVLGAMAISLLPVIFMFFSSYALLNHSLSRWFPQSLEEAAKDSKDLVNNLGIQERERLNSYAQIAAQELGTNPSPEALNALLKRFMPGADGILVLDANGLVLRSAATFPIPPNAPGALDKPLPSGAEVWRVGDIFSTVGRAPLGAGSVMVLRRTSANIIQRPERINHEVDQYFSEAQRYRALKTQLLMALSLFTVMLLFAVTWIALYLSNQVTLPIQALADGTREVSKGNFDYRVEAQAQDELGSLVSSFNAMTSQLADSRHQINEFTRNLQKALQEIESRRKLLETVLENIPTGVISLDAGANVLRVNSSAVRIFGEQARAAKSLSEIVGEQASRDFQALLRRSQRLGAVSRALELRISGRFMHAAVTVSALGTSSANSGYVVVVDDLTDLLRAQKLAAWQEVAQRIAHEIKNPLTPIQLSADRLARYLSRRTADPSQLPRDAGLELLVSECATSIGREVESLKSLVDEFSRFVRFPQARLAVADANTIVHQALDVFRGRLDGITLRTDFSRELPAIKADSELLRGVVVNLIDNAAEALVSSPVKELQLTTRRSRSGDALEIIVADTGCGISPEDKDKLFLPHFSTKDRGTGLGLAIAARVAAEHNGTLRVEDNSPVGSRFILRIPATEVAASPIASGG